MKISQQEIITLAKLAGISLNQTEIDDYQQQLSSILSLINQLQEVTVDDLLATEQVTGLVNVVRSDQVSKSDIDLKLLQAAGFNIHKQQFKIKKVNF